MSTRAVPRPQARRVRLEDRPGRARAQRPQDPLRRLFVVHALVEYARAGGDPAALAEARTLFELLVERAHDDAYGGWVEHFGRGWRPPRWSGRGFEVEIPGLKSANTHLHAMEALTELETETRDPTVEATLGETVDLITGHFFPDDPGAAAQHRSRDWRPDGRAGVSLGHNVEYAWLLLRVERILGREPSRNRFDAYISATLEAQRPARIWWEDAELLAALATGLRVARRPASGGSLGPPRVPAGARRRPGGRRLAAHGGGGRRAREHRQERDLEGRLSRGARDNNARRGARRRTRARRSEGLARRRARSPRVRSPGPGSPVPSNRRRSHPNRIPGRAPHRPGPRPG